MPDGPDSDAHGATAARAGHPHACYYFGAEDGTRTRDPNLGKVVLYQLSHFRERLTGAEAKYIASDCAGAVARAGSAPLLAESPSSSSRSAHLEDGLP